MEVKEAIEKIKIWYQTYLANSTSIFNDDKTICEIIDLLKRGEKFEEMWEEFLKKWGAYQIVLAENKTSTFPIYTYMNEFEQKYFPKEAEK